MKLHTYFFSILYKDEERKSWNCRFNVVCATREEAVKQVTLDNINKMRSDRCLTPIFELISFTAKN